MWHENKLKTKADYENPSVFYKDKYLKTFAKI